MVLWFPVTKLIRRHLARQVHVGEKGVVRIITMEELEKQNKKPENSPLLRGKDETQRKNDEISKSTKSLNQSLEKLAFIDSSDATQSNDISLSNCDSNKKEEEQDTKTKL